MTLDHMEDNVPVDSPRWPRYALMRLRLLFDLLLIAFSAGVLVGVFVTWLSMR